MTARTSSAWVHWLPAAVCRPGRPVGCEQTCLNCLCLKGYKRSLPYVHRCADLVELTCLTCRQLLQCTPTCMLLTRQTSSTLILLTPSSTVDPGTHAVPASKVLHATATPEPDSHFLVSAPHRCTPMHSRCLMLYAAS